MGGVRVCDNCGALSDGPRCTSCGRPFPPPPVSAPHEEQVRFDPPAEVQRPVLRRRPAGQRIVLPPPGEPEGQVHETYRPYSATDVSYGSVGRRANGAIFIGVLSLVLSVTGGSPSLILGLVAVYMGKRARDRGMEWANAAIVLGVLGVVITLVFGIFWYSRA